MVLATRTLIDRSKGLGPVAKSLRMIGLALRVLKSVPLCRIIDGDDTPDAACRSGQEGVEVCSCRVLAADGDET